MPVFGLAAPQAKALEADGLIERERRVVRFPQWERLKKAADFTERYLHLGPQQPSAG